MCIADRSKPTRVEDPQEPTTVEHLSNLCGLARDTFAHAVGITFDCLDDTLGVDTTDVERAIHATFALHTTLSCILVAFLSDSSATEIASEWYGLLPVVAICAGFGFFVAFSAITVTGFWAFEARVLAADVYPECMIAVKDTMKFWGRALLAQVAAMVICGALGAFRLLVAAGFVGTLMALGSVVALSHHVTDVSLAIDVAASIKTTRLDAALPNKLGANGYEAAGQHSTEAELIGEQSLAALMEHHSRTTAENEELTTRVNVMRGTICKLANRTRPLRQELGQLQAEVMLKDSKILHIGSQLAAKTNDLEAAVKKNQEWLTEHEEEVAKAYQQIEKKDALVAGLRVELEYWKTVNERNRKASLEILETKVMAEIQSRSENAESWRSYYQSLTDATQTKLEAKHSKALIECERSWKAKWSTDLKQLSLKKDEELQQKDKQILALAEHYRLAQQASHGAHRAELKNAWDNAHFCHEKQKEAESTLKTMQAAGEGWHDVDDAEARAAVAEEAAAMPKCLSAEGCKDDDCFCRNVVEAEKVFGLLDSFVDNDLDDADDLEGCETISMNDLSEHDVDYVLE